MGKIYKLSDKNGNVLYPMTIGDAIAVDGMTLTNKLATAATQEKIGMLSAADKTKLDGIEEGATANVGTVTGVTIKAGTGISLDSEAEITVSGERTVSLATSGVSAGTYKSVTVDTYGRVTAGSNPTTLSGYGITDAKIEGGVITLGSQTITPLTDDSNYVTLDGSQALTNKTYNGYTLADAAAKSVDTDTMTADSVNLPTSKAVVAYVDSALVSVLKYKGTVDSTHPLPASHKVGDTYVVAESGTYAGQACEIGDYIICKTAGSTSSDAHWNVVSGENQVSDGNPTLDWGTQSKVATVDGTDIHVTMPANPASNKADKATTLAGYGITDAKIEGGVITLGANTITPLTEHQDISGKADKATTLAGYGITDAKIADGIITLGTNTIKPLTEHQDISGKADKATTLAGYGITDAKIEGGVITLGGNTITPLTAHQSLDGKQDKITVSGILKGDGNGSVSAAVAGTDYLAPVTATTDSPTSTQIIKSVTQGTDGKISVVKSGFTIATSVPENAVFTDTTYDDATTSAHGLMTAAMVTKLNGIEEGATKIVATAVTETDYNDTTIENIIKGVSA